MTYTTTRTPKYTVRTFDDFVSYSLDADGLTCSHFISDAGSPHTTIYVHDVTAIKRDSGLVIRTERGTVYVRLIPAENVWPAPDPSDLEHCTHAHPGAPR